MNCLRVFVFMGALVFGPAAFAACDIDSLRQLDKDTLRMHYDAGSCNAVLGNLRLMVLKHGWILEKELQFRDPQKDNQTKDITSGFVPGFTYTVELYKRVSPWGWEWRRVDSEEIVWGR